MKKSIVILTGAAVAAGFSLLTAFGGTMTKAQQMAEVASKVTTELSALRDMKGKECEESIAREANAKAQTMLAAPMPAQIVPAIPGKGPAKPTKKPSKGKNDMPGKVDPMPQPAPPPAKKPEDKGKMDRGDAVTPASKMERGDAVKPAEAGSKMKRGDAVVKKSGGGN
jgi:hypothetical protein